MRIQQQDSTRSTTKKSFVFETTNKAGLKKINSFIDFTSKTSVKDKNQSPIKIGAKHTEVI